MPRVDLSTLRHFAAARTLAVHPTIERAVAALGFVQADPIRAPARAQDLILRHRVVGYRDGDLERAYPDLGLDEDTLHVYGFLSGERRALLHPRPLRGRWQRLFDENARMKRRIVAFARENRHCAPRDVERAVGSSRSENAWGGRSATSTLLLEGLHFTGILRVARREGGQRIYEIAPKPAPLLRGAQRAERLAAWMAHLYAPIPESSLRRALAAIRATDVPAFAPGRAIQPLVARGELTRAVVDGAAWIWPAADDPSVEADERVRLLAPFDPIVWDRARFARLWDWEYRFEAYTPVEKRKLGYYALPLLYREKIIGWGVVDGDASAREPGLKIGFFRGRPRERAFSRELDAEIARFRAFLG